MRSLERLSRSLRRPFRYVKVDSGTVRGVAAGGVISFKGIPYAAPPVGKSALAGPQPAKPWDGVLDATAFGPCVHADRRSAEIGGLSDAQRLAAAATSDAPLPVMVWIYGGALAHGNTPQYPADALAAQGVIVVSMNYRMGRLGFFAHPALAKEAPDEPRGNYGYLDQLAALKWVQRNIAAFGGDPKKVTIFGEFGRRRLGHGAYGFAALARAVPAAILQSPGVPTARAEVTPLTALDDAEKARSPMRARLGSKATAPGAGGASRASGREAGRGRLGTRGAGRNGERAAGRRRLGRHPRRPFPDRDARAAFAAGRQAMVPVIVGANNRDLGIGMAATKDDLFALFGVYAPEARSALRSLPATRRSDELKQQVFADKTLVEPSRHLADEMARAGQPTWWYRFSYVAELLRERSSGKGTLHGFEIPYTFDIPAGARGRQGNRRGQGDGCARQRLLGLLRQDRRPERWRRPEWPQHDPVDDRVIDFTNDGSRRWARPDQSPARPLAEGAGRETLNLRDSYRRSRSFRSAIGTKRTSRHGAVTSACYVLAGSTCYQSAR